MTTSSAQAPCWEDDAHAPCLGLEQWKLRKKRGPEGGAPGKALPQAVPEASLPPSLGALAGLGKLAPVLLTCALVAEQGPWQPELAAWHPAATTVRAPTRKGRA